MLPARESWVPTKAEEVHSGAIPDNGISRIHSGHCGDGDKASIRQAKENQGRVWRLGKEEVVSAGSLAQLIGKMNTTSRVIPPDYFVLLTLANEVVCRVEQGSLRLQSSVNTGPGVPE